MKKVYAAVAIAGMMLLASCQAPEPPPAPEPSAIEAEPSPEPEPEMVLIASGIRLAESSAFRLSDGRCVPNAPELSKYFADLDGTQVAIYDSSHSVVATVDIFADHSGDGCYWGFATEIERGSDFYSAEFAGLSTPIASAGDVVDGVLELDILAPITDDAAGATQSLLDAYNRAKSRSNN